MSPNPLFALSETANTAGRVAALNCGADDVLKKPFALDECLARARALLRRQAKLNPVTGRSYALVGHGDLLLDTARRLVSVAGEPVALTRMEYELLLYFLKNLNQALSFEQIYDAVWKDAHDSVNSIRVVIFYQVGNLRKKLNVDWIESRRGVGFYIHSPSE